MKKIYFLFLALLTFLFLATPSLAKEDNEYFKDSRIESNCDFYTKEQLENMNILLKNIKEDKGTDIYVVVLNTDEYDNIYDRLGEIYVEAELTSSYLLGIDPVGRNFSAYSNSFFISMDSYVSNAREDFKNNDFYTGLIKIICNVGNYKIPEDINNITPTLKTKYYINNLDDHIVDFSGLLSENDIWEIASTLSQIESHYDININFIFFNEVEPNFSVADYTAETGSRFINSFGDDILISICLQDKFYSKYEGATSIDIDSVYIQYGRSYFHSENPNYKDALLDIAFGAVVDKYGITLEEAKAFKDISMSDIAEFRIFVTIALIIFGIVIFVVFGNIISNIAENRRLAEIEKNKVSYNKNDYTEAVKEVKQWLNLEKQMNQQMYKTKEHELNESLDDFYEDVSDNLTEDTPSFNVFDVDYEQNDDLVVENINKMIEEVISKSKGVKDDYSQLQTVLDIYNNLSFTTKIKISRKFSSELETLTRKAKMDLEHYERTKALKE